MKYWSKNDRFKKLKRTAAAFVVGGFGFVDLAGTTDGEEGVWTGSADTQCQGRKHEAFSFEVRACLSVL